MYEENEVEGEEVFKLDGEEEEASVPPEEVAEDFGLEDPDDKYH